MADILTPEQVAALKADGTGQMQDPTNYRLADQFGLGRRTVALADSHEALRSHLAAAEATAAAQARLITEMQEWLKAGRAPGTQNDAYWNGFYHQRNTTREHLAELLAEHHLHEPTRSSKGEKVDGPLRY